MIAQKLLIRIIPELYNLGTGTDMKKLLASLLLIFLALGCTSGSTDGGDANDAGGDVFVPDSSNTGSVSLDVTDSNLSVSDVTGFRFSVVDNDGNPVENIAVACDSESGIAIIEPTTGRETTDSNGQISGKIGCRFGGSYLFGCRLPVGANMRKFETVICTGTSPEGFDGFPNAAGGGLGGGSAEDDDGAGPGGTDPDGIRILSVTLQNVQAESSTRVDTTRTVCTGGSLESWGDDEAIVTIVNNSNSIVRFNTASFAARQSSPTGGTVSSNQAVTCEVGPNGAQKTCSFPFATIAGVAGGSTKNFAGTSTSMSALSGTRSVEFSFSGTWRGEDVDISSSQNISFANYDRC